MVTHEKFVYIGVTLALIYAIYKERQALGCKCIPDGSDCDNANGKAVEGTAPLENDDIDVLSNKILKASKFMNRWVIWRMAFMMSFICTILVSLMSDRNVPDAKHLLISMIVITFVIYATINFYGFHLISYIEKNIEKCLNKMKNICKF